jgi:integrase
MTTGPSEPVLHAPLRVVNANLYARQFAELCRFGEIRPARHRLPRLGALHTPRCVKDCAGTYWVDAWRMIQRRAAELGMRIKIGCHTFRATGITAYLEAGGTLENAQLTAAHESPRTTKLYDRTGDEITLDEVERISI